MFVESAGSPPHPAPRRRRVILGLLVACLLFNAWLGYLLVRPRLRTPVANNLRQAPARATGPLPTIGNCGRPFGTRLTLQGVVERGSGKGAGNPILRVQRIDGTPTQADLRVSLASPAHTRDVPGITVGGTFEVTGEEAVEPWYHRRTFLVQESQPLEPIVWSPAEFVDASAVIIGRAIDDQGRACVAGDDWLLVVDDVPWPAHCLEKEAQAYGVIHGTADPHTFRLAQGTAGLLHLADQIGRGVNLRCMFWSGQGLLYRGEFLEFDAEFSPHGWHGRAVRVTGILDVRTAVQRTDRQGSPPQPRYVVRQAVLTADDDLLAPELE